MIKKMIATEFNRGCNRYKDLNVSLIYQLALIDLSLFIQFDFFDNLLADRLSKSNLGGPS